MLDLPRRSMETMSSALSSSRDDATIFSTSSLIVAALGAAFFARGMVSALLSGAIGQRQLLQEPISSIAPCPSQFCLREPGLSKRRHGSRWLKSDSADDARTSKPASTPVPEGGQRFRAFGTWQIAGPPWRPVHHKYMKVCQKPQLVGDEISVSSPSNGQTGADCLPPSARRSGRIGIVLPVLP